MDNRRSVFSDVPAESLSDYGFDMYCTLDRVSGKPDYVALDPENEEDDDFYEQEKV